MRKGFTVTLLTVAVAMMGSNAMSMAPVISNIKDIVVADDSGVSGSNLFVYPDAIDLSSVVSDGDTADNALSWFYYEPTNTYNINATPSVTVGEVGVLPPAGKLIAGPSATTGDDPDAIDSDLYTITVRNISLSPVGGPNVADQPGSGILASYTRPVFFYVTDEDQYTSAAAFIYTEDDGTDRLSPGGAGDEIINIDFSTGAQGWQGQTELQANGGSATFAQTGSGLCLTVTAAGDNIVKWFSPYGLLDLTDNTVYEIRATMSTTQTGEDLIPFWDLGIINLDVTGAQTGANSYGANFYFLDNLGDLANDDGGSQGIGNFRNEFVVYWTPLSVSLPTWRSPTTGAFQPASDPFNDAQLSFRVFDLASSSYGGAADFGTVCLGQLQVIAHNLDDIQIGTTDYSDTSLAAGDVTAGGPGTTATFAGGAVTLSPSSGTGWESGQIDVVPGTGTIDTSGGPQPTESWPLTWPSDVLYLISVDASIPTALTQTNGAPDIITVMLEGHVQTYQQSFVLPNVRYNGQGAGGAGLPPVAPSTGTYKAFGYTNESSKSIFYDRLRPHINMLNVNGIAPDPATGSISFHGITVQKATF
jgi:hypothetical protein